MLAKWTLAGHPIRFNKWFSNNNLCCHYYSPTPYYFLLSLMKKYDSDFFTQQYSIGSLLELE